jgi:hypothetical protein
LRPPGRGQRLAAVLFDFATAALAVAAAALLATLWLLARTDRGRHDPASADVLITTALILAAPPAWAAWQLLRIRRGGSTAGQLRLSLAVESDGQGARSARPGALLRLAYHPLSITAWLWLVAVALLLGSTLIALALLGAAGVCAAGGGVSAALVLRDPGARALHDRLAGTRLVRR